MRLLICRPTEPMTKHLMMLRLGTRKWNFRNRDREVFHTDAKKPLNQRTLNKLHYRLHYLARHAPDKVMKQWENAYQNFHYAHFGKSAGYFRYLNNWSYGASL
jgi:hypothetical protein